MRSLKDFKLGVFDLIPGKFYVLEILSRDYLNHFLFEFDSIINMDEKIIIRQRNKWVVNGNLRVCDGVESLYITDQGDKIKLSRYYKKINWDEYNQ